MPKAGTPRHDRVVGCPRCGAEPGERCVSANNRVVATKSHRARTSAARMYFAKNNREKDQ